MILIWTRVQLPPSPQGIKLLIRGVLYYKNVLWELNAGQPDFSVEKLKEARSETNLERRRKI